MFGGINMSRYRIVNSRLSQVDESGRLNSKPEGADYELPRANSTALGGVKAKRIKVEDNTEVRIDSDGFLYVEVPEVEEYTLPKADLDELGGVKAYPIDNDDVIPVSIDDEGYLWAKSESDEYKSLIDISSKYISSLRWSDTSYGGLNPYVDLDSQSNRWKLRSEYSLAILRNLNNVDNEVYVEIEALNESKFDSTFRIELRTSGGVVKEVLAEINLTLGFNLVKLNIPTNPQFGDLIGLSLYNENISLSESVRLNSIDFKLKVDN